jgi:hypothetical protein
MVTRILILVLCLSGCGVFELHERRKILLTECQEELNECSEDLLSNLSCRAELNGCKEQIERMTVPEERTHYIESCLVSRNYYRGCARKAGEYGLALYECEIGGERFESEREHACTDVDQLEEECPIFRGGTHD